MLKDNSIRTAQWAQETEFFNEYYKEFKSKYIYPQSITKKCSKFYDYKGCSFECRVKFSEQDPQQLKELFLYAKDNEIVLTKLAYDPNPYFLIYLEPWMEFSWLIEKNQQNTSQPPNFVGFKLVLWTKELIFKAQSIVVEHIKEHCRRFIFQRKFQDTYDVISQIGKGNYARVFLIQNRHTQQKFACKCFEKKKLVEMENGIASLHNELKVMRYVDNNEDIIKLHEVYQGDNTFYLVMELLEGPSLYDEIKEYGDSSFPQESVYNIMKSLVEGVEYCTENGIMHRDLKPENMMFKTKNPSANKHVGLKIVDFGLGTLQTEKKYIFPKCGTPGFVAPEIANLADKSSQYSVICDMFSVGVIFHILLTGNAVFPGKKFNEVLKKNKDCKINFDAQEYDYLPYGAKDLLEKMLQKEPKNRITAQQALDHAYFTKGKPRRNSLNQQSQSMEEEDNGIRPKQKTLFAKPLRLPYIGKNDNSLNMTDENGHGSFVTQDPTSKFKSQASGSGDMSNSPFGSPFIASQINHNFTFSPNSSQYQGNGIPQLDLNDGKGTQISKFAQPDFVQENKQGNYNSVQKQPQKDKKSNFYAMK